jgi:hypothetical protein
MSVDLNENIWAKTMPDYSDPAYPAVVFLHDQESGHNVEARLEQAVAELRRALLSKELVDDPTFQSFFAVLKSMYPQDIGDRWGASEQVLTRHTDWEMPEDYIGPSVEVMRTQLNASELADFTYYVFTNTGLEGADDPRQQFLDELRGNTAPEVAH